MVDNSKYLKLLKQETNKIPFNLSVLKKVYERKLSYLTDSPEDQLIKEYFENLILEFNFGMNRIIPSQIMNLLVVPLLGKCNLNCKGCDAYAPLCQNNKDYYPAVDIRKDLQILKEKNFYIKEISLEGGEPFLHPELLEATRNAREIYKDSIVTILTNGTLLQEKDDDFYRELSNLRCTLVVDKYFDMEGFDERINHIQSLGVNVELDGCVDGSGWFHRAPVNLIDKTFPEDENARHFVQCEKANNIYTLDRGFIYQCGRSASIKYFNDFFNKDLPDEGIDIKKYSGSEIAQLLATPNNLCKYCKHLTMEKMAWDESKLDIKEWADV